LGRHPDVADRDVLVLADLSSLDEVVAQQRIGEGPADARSAHALVADVPPVLAKIDSGRVLLLLRAQAERLGLPQRPVLVLGVRLDAVEDTSCRHGAGAYFAPPFFFFAAFLGLGGAARSTFGLGIGCSSKVCGGLTGWGGRTVVRVCTK